MTNVLFALQLVLFSSPVASWVVPGFWQVPKMVEQRQVTDGSGSGTGSGSTFQSGTGSGAGSNPIDFFTPVPTPMTTEVPTPMATSMPTPEPTIAFEQFEDFAFLSCNGGASRYTKKDIDVLEKQVLIGTIPKGQVDLDITLTGVRGDVDVQLVTSDGDFIVGFESDCIKTFGPSTGTCNGMEISYSGYIGSTESIKISGPTSIDLNLYLYVYEFNQGESSVDADVKYSWESTDTPCCRREELCSSSFDFDLVEGNGQLLGVFDVGIESLRIEIEADGDLDLYVVDAGDPEKTAIAKAFTGVLGGFMASSAEYKGRTYAYSGWSGAGFGQMGNEWFEVEGTTNIPLEFGVSAYTDGSGTVTYYYMAA